MQGLCEPSVMDPNLLLPKGTPFLFVLPALDVRDEQERPAGLSEAQIPEVKDRTSGPRATRLSGSTDL